MSPAAERSDRPLSDAQLVLFCTAVLAVLLSVLTLAVIDLILQTAPGYSPGLLRTLPALFAVASGVYILYVFRRVVDHYVLSHV